MSVLRIKRNPLERDSLGNYISGTVNISCLELHYKDGVTIHDRVTFLGNKVKLGKNVWIGQDCILDGTGDLEIGDNTAIGAGTYIFTHLGKYGKIDFAKKVKIGDNVWIMPQVFINPGVTIGDNATIYNRSLVTKDVPANAKIKGSPAKPILTQLDYELE